MEQKFIVYNGIVSSDVFTADYDNDPRVTVLRCGKPIKSKLLRFVKRVHLSYKLNKIIDLPFKQIWHDAFRSIEWDKDTEYFVFFRSAALYPISVKFLNSLKSKYNIHYILGAYDHWTSPFNMYAREYAQKMDFDYIFTIDPADAEKYNFIYYPTPYSILKHDIDNRPIKYDLYFCGRDKGRSRLLHDIYIYKQDINANVCYKIADVEQENKISADNVVYLEEMMDYSEVLDDVLSSNCILEIMFEGQTGMTLRYYEAVCYNKKLLTNNKDIVNMPFYDPRYMKVFEKPEDIDVEWVRKREEVDYHYDGRYSPVHLIDKILELENLRKGRNK